MDVAGEAGGDPGGDKPADAAGEKRDIRRPMNAFLIFCKRHRSMVREKHPDRDNRSVTRILGDLWANLPEDEKSVYTNLAKQYKDAFMKANPDYKWHSTDRLPQPAKMATRPTNNRPPRSLSTSDCPSGLLSSEGDKLGGLNLLLMAGQQSMPAHDRHAVMSHVLERRMTSPELMGANSALLQLAEMCSTELHGQPTEPAAIRKAPPKKRARHWSYSDVGHGDLACRSKIPPASLLFPPIPNPALKANQPAATKTSQSEGSFQKQNLPDNQPGSMFQKLEKVTQQVRRPAEFPNHTAAKSVKDFNTLWAEARKDDVGVKTQLTPKHTLDSFVFDHEAKPVTIDSAVPPKRKFTKLHDSFKNERQPPPTVTPEAGSLSDQNDNAIFTCGKLVVDHIIDRLFTANLATSEKNHATANPSFTDIEKVRKIITADMTEREGSKRPANKQVGKLLSEVVQQPQNLVEKVIEEAYNMGVTKLNSRRKPPAQPSLHKLDLWPKQEKPELWLKQEKPELWLKQEKPELLLNRESQTPKPVATVAKQESVITTRLEPISEQQGSETSVHQPSFQEQTAVMLKVIPSSASSDLPHGASLNSSQVSPPPRPAVIPPFHGEAKDSSQVSPQPRPAVIVLPPIHGEVKDSSHSQISPQPKVGVAAAAGQVDSKDSGEDRYPEDLTADHSKDDSGDMQDDDDGYSQPVRKSRRRNRGQRYQELINEGIIQPSKERLAARRYEQGAHPTSMSMNMCYVEDGRDDDGSMEGRPHFHLKRSVSESDSNPGDEKRYCTGDFDLEAEIATLPPCSLDQVSRRRIQRKRSDSESSRKTGPPSSPTHTEGGIPEGPLTGSQKRKARKHSINRLVASTESGGSTSVTAPGIAESVPMVRDPTKEWPPPTTPTTVPPSTTPAMQPDASLTSSSSGNLSQSTETGDRKLEIAASVEEKLAKEMTTTGEHERKVTDDAKRTSEQEKSTSDIDKNGQADNSKIGDSCAMHEGRSGKSDSSSSVALTGLKRKNVPEPIEGVSSCSLPMGNSCVDLESKSVSSKNVNIAADAVKIQAKVVSGLKDSKPTTGDTMCPGVVFNSAETLSADPNRRPLHQEGKSDSISEITSKPGDRDSRGNSEPKLCNSEESRTADEEGKGRVGEDSIMKRSGSRYPQELDGDSNLSSTGGTDNGGIFLSETSGLLCAAIDEDDVLPVADSTLKQQQEEGDVLIEQLDEKPSFAFSSETKPESVLEAPKFGELLKEEDNLVSLGDSFPSSRSESSPVAMETSDSLDSSSGNGMIVTVSSSGCFSSTDMDTSPFASRVHSATEACVTTVTMTNSDAMPTALTLEMMNEGETVDSGVGNPILCGSLPGSPSMAVVHS
ncbi:serine-rich adhesin for platelets-like isoform X2 [Littorina saxatilis]|uniref:HMG box domain-containing protein n=1 Tax=Littorina saxatilis TaxID=31220 RepID=A0AAN9GFB4_9CAEN